MQVKVFREDSQNNFNQWLEKYRQDPTGVEVDWILEDPVVNRKDEIGQIRQNDHHYYIHARCDEYSGNKFNEFIGFYNFMAFIFEDGSICYNKESMSLNADEREGIRIRTEYAQELDRCFRAGKGTEGGLEYVDLDDIVF